MQEVPREKLRKTMSEPLETQVFIFFFGRGFFRKILENCSGAQIGISVTKRFRSTVISKKQNQGLLGVVIYDRNSVKGLTNRKCCRLEKSGEEGKSVLMDRWVVCRDSTPTSNLLIGELKKWVYQVYSSLNQKTNKII